MHKLVLWRIKRRPHTYKIKVDQIYNNDYVPK